MNEILLAAGAALSMLSVFSYSGLFPPRRAHQEFLLVFFSGIYVVSHHSSFGLPAALLGFRVLFYIFWIHLFTRKDLTLKAIILSWIFIAVAASMDLIGLTQGSFSVKGTQTLLLFVSLYLRYSTELKKHRKYLAATGKKIRLLRKQIIREEKEIARIKERFENRIITLNDELIIARDIQKGMIPPLSFCYANVRGEGHYEYRESTGGDYFDIFMTREGDPGFVIGDVSGSGISAGLVMTIAKLSFRKAVSRYSMPSEIFTEVNRELYSILRFEQFMSAFMIIIKRDGSAVYANTGHPAPLLLRRKQIRHNPGEVRYSRYGLEELHITGGLFLGSLPSPLRTYDQKEIRLFPGDRIILFTDGFLNQENKQRSTFGSGYWESVLVSASDLSLEECRTSLIYAFNEHRGNVPLNDDTMFVILEYFR